MSTNVDSRQVRKRQALSKLGTAVNTTVETVLDQINTEVDSPLRLAASATPDAFLNFSASLISAADTGKKVVSPVKKQVFAAITASTINFQTQALSNAAFFDITWPVTNNVGQFRYAGFTLIGSGKIKVLFSAEAASEAALSNPGALFVAGGLPIGYIALQCTSTSGFFKTSGSATNIIENLKIFRLAAGGGSSSSSSSSGAGGELVDMQYLNEISDPLSDIPDGTTTIDIAAGKTDTSLFDVANELFRLNYDASKTVTGTGTAMTLSGTPGFTVKAGDILVVNSEARVITALSSQTAYTIEAAFSTNPAAAAANVSQVVHTVDLNNMTAGGLSAASQYTSNIDELTIGYADSTTLSDVIPDYGAGTPSIAYSASADASSWTTARARVDGLSATESFVATPTSGTQLKLRFFANKTSGSGAVNLLSFKVFFQKQLGQASGATYYTAFARPTGGLTQNCSIGLVSGKTRFTFTFPFSRGLNSGEASGSALEVIVNGQVIPRRVAALTDDTQAYFNEISDSVIEMDTDYSSAGVDFQFKVQRLGIIDTNTTNTTKISFHDDLLDQSIDAQIVPTFLTAVNGAAVSGVSFRSDITNRANIPDLSSMLSVQLGPQRTMTQDFYQILGESGPAGQAVFGATNDRFNQVRAVGTFSRAVDNNGPYIQSSTTTDYVEFVFYGTGINIIGYSSSSFDMRASTDGGAEGSNLYVSGSTILTARNYSANVIIPAVAGLTLGMHTVKVRANTTSGIVLFGYEILTETSSLRVAPGVVVKGKYKNTLSALTTVAYDSGFESGTLGVRGGCALVYLKNDGTIGKAVTPVDATSLFLTSTSHVNEEITATHNYRAFSAGLTTDFHNVSTTSIRAFPLDDNTTVLNGGNVLRSVGTFGDGLATQNLNSFLAFTFIGSGCDIYTIAGAAGQTDPIAVVIDGVSIGNITLTGVGTIKLCSGLPYGSHTVKLTRTLASAGQGFFSSFIVYSPKKPALPAGSIELGQYYNNATYVAATVAAQYGIGTGVNRRNNIREAAYSGTWTLTGTPDPSSFETGWNITTTTATAFVEYTFFGTGIVYNGLAQTGGAQNSTMLIDGVNVSSYTTSIVQSTTGLTFSAAGVLGGTPSAQSHYRLSVSGLPLGKHTIRMTNNSTQGLYFDGLDVITPIYSPSLNSNYVLQNMLTLGNNSILDLRKFHKTDLVSYYKTVAITGGTTTSATSYEPFADMTVEVNVPNIAPSIFQTLKLDISYAAAVYNSSATAYTQCRIYVDGVAVGTDKLFRQQGTANLSSNIADSIVVPISPGQHIVSVYWLVTAGTATSEGLSRNLIVKVIGA